MTTITFTMTEAHARLVMRAAQIAADSIAYGRSEKDDEDAEQFRALELAMHDAIDRAAMQPD